MTPTTTIDPVFLNEKRRHPRFTVGLSLDISASGHTAGKCRGTIADLSAGGMTFKTNAELEKGMHLFLKLDTPLQIRGEIRHIKGGVHGGLHSYGVRFHKIDFDAQRPSQENQQ
jgi:c-di-GMP-binding flagellar brake protein YcgR